MGITPQFIYGKDGLPTNVVIAFEEWQQLQETVNNLPPAWQIEESKRRVLHAEENPSTLIPLDEFLKELDTDDDSL